MKAILLMNMPEACSICDFSGSDGDRCYILGEDISEEMYMNDEKLVNCPLQEMPEKMEVCGKYPQPGPVPSYRIGWNNCIDRILGKEN